MRALLPQGALTPSTGDRDSAHRIPVGTVTWSGPVLSGGKDNRLRGERLRATSQSPCAFAHTRKGRRRIAVPCRDLYPGDA